MDNSIIYFAKVKKDAVIPTKITEDAGYDIYANFKEDYIVIMPHETKMIDTGIASAFSDNYVMVLKERGSTGTKGIAQRCGIIDSGFRNEWKVPITNTTNHVLIISKLSKKELFDKKSNEFSLNLKDDCIVYPYTKAITQALLLPVPKMTVDEISYKQLLNFKSERGIGMLGSSSK